VSPGHKGKKFFLKKVLTFFYLYAIINTETKEREENKMKFNTIVAIHFDEEDNLAWSTLYKAVGDLAHKPCEDADVAEAVNNLYEAMVNFITYLDE
jgi:hypothetical protein